MQFASPLRYPGGKRKLASFITDVIIENEIQGGTYIEPYAGGASIAFHLIFNEYVNEVVINDIDKSIYSFWFCVLNYEKELCDRITNTPITIDEWYKQKEVQLNKDSADIIDLAFSTFFLNRTNRSGIIKGGVIGGKEQAGKWKMNVRYNKEDLVSRIMRIALYKDRIKVHCLDSIDFLQSELQNVGSHSLVYLDPPYYNKGSALYVNHYTKQDHMKLAGFIKGMQCKWVLTYDYTPDIIGLYKDVDMRLLTINYTASNKIEGYEMLAFSEGLRVPQNEYTSITIE